MELPADIKCESCRRWIKTPAFTDNSFICNDCYRNKAEHICGTCFRYTTAVNDEGDCDSCIVTRCADG